MLELHIWGPAFSLPSIDPQCNAAVAYLNLTLPKNEWTVIASSNPLLSPTRQLPALRDGRTWAAGFRGIVEYVRKKSQGNADLDSFLGDIEKAECIAFSAFLETHGQSLIDLSLYVSRKNFDAVTRSVYATLLPFPMQYYTPVVVRSQAKARTEGLGVTALDIDTSEPPASASVPIGTPHTTIPTAPGKKSILTATEAAATFRLMHLVRDFLQPLQPRLGSSRYFFGSNPSTFDCLAIGYLSLCLYPELPLPWLATEIKKGFGDVFEYVEDIRTPLLGEAIDAKEVLAYTRSSSEQGKTPVSEIPWGVVERGDLPWMSGFLLDRALDAVGWGRGAQIQEQKQKERERAMDPGDLERKRKMEAAIRSQRIRGALTVVGGIAAFLGYCIWTGLIQIQVRDTNEEENEEENEEKDKDENEGGYVMPNENGPGGYGGLAGALLGLRRPPASPDGPETEEKTEDEEELSPEEEREIVEDISAEEAEVDDAIAKDMGDHIKDRGGSS